MELRFFLRVGLLSLFEFLSIPDTMGYDPVYRLRQFLSDDFSNENVRSIFQDSQGFLWMGVDSEGLCKYDCSRFEIFGHQSLDSTSISSNYINDIKEGPFGNIWLATERGLNVFDKAGRTVSKIRLGGRQDEVANTVFICENGSGLIGTEDGIFRVLVQRDRNSRDRYNVVADNLTNVLQGVAVTSILQGQKDEYWLGTRAGLYHYSYTTGEYQHWCQGDGDYSLTEDEINSLEHLDERYLIIGTDNGINVFDTQSKKFYLTSFPESGLFKDGVLGIVKVLKDSRDVVWIGTTTYGIITGQLVETHGSRPVFELRIPAKISGLASSYITDIIEDQNNQLLVATKFGGVFVYDRRSSIFPHYRLEETDQVSDQDQSFIISAAQADNGFIWIGTRDRGLVRLDLKDHSYRDFVMNQGIDKVRRIETIFCESGDVVWIGNKKGLNKLNITTQRYDYFPFSKVMCIAEASVHDLWVGTRSGLFRIDKRSGKPNPHQSSHSWFFNNSELQVSKLLMEKDGILWVGTDKLGLFMYNTVNDELIRYSAADGEGTSISGNAIRSIFRDSNGRLWVGTKSSGLNLFDGRGGFAQFNEKSGLPSNTIFSILEDRQGFIWVATNNGLSRFDVENRKFLNFTKSHGLQGNVFEKYASIHLQDGRLFVAGNDGYNLFDPAEIKLDDYNPSIVITQVRSNSNVVERDVFKSKLIKLDHKQKVLSFEFAALDYRDVDAIQYMYRLEGVDQEWVTSANINQVTYSNLPHGSQTFMVKATNADGIWSDTHLSLNIDIETPPWLSWWAWCLYVGLILGLIYLIYWSAHLRAAFAHNLRTKQLELNQANELTKLKMNFFTNISHELRTPLTLILAPLEKIRETRLNDDIRKRVSIAYRSAMQLLNLTEQLMYFRKIEQGTLPLQVNELVIDEFLKDLMKPYAELAESRHVAFKAIFPDTKIKGYADKDKIEKICNNFIINAFKFTPEGGSITVEVSSVYRSTQELSAESDVHCLYVAISDTGEGIPAEEIEHIFDRYYQLDGVRNGNGIGLELVKSLVKLHKGEIMVKSALGEGTTFSVVIPIDPNLYDISSRQDFPKEPELSYQVLEPLENFELKKSTSGKRLLIVEDNVDLLSFLASLMSEDYEVEMAVSGADGLEKANDFVPDIILSDVMMADGNGLELCRQIKSNLATSHIPVVLFTARSHQEHQLEGFESGADDYIVKPFDSRVLKAKLKALLQNRERIVKTIKEGLDFEPSRISKNSMDVRFMTRILEIMEKNYVNVSFSVEDIAYDLHLSRSQLFRKIKSLTDQTPSEYLYAFRIKKAIALLEDSDLNISEIAYKTGFSSPNSFGKTFSKHVGMPPTKYLRKVLKVG